jgi:hypothetical protein
MATDDNTPPAGEGQPDSDLRIETKRVLFEVQLTLESVSAGLETIARVPEAQPVFEQIGVLQKMTGQAAETVEGFAATLRDMPAN